MTSPPAPSAAPPSAAPPSAVPPSAVPSAAPSAAPPSLAASSGAPDGGPLLRVSGRRGTWARLDLTLGAGLHGLVAPPAALDALARACAGLERGEVRVALGTGSAGAPPLEPACSARARAALDVALRDEPPWSRGPLTQAPALVGRAPEPRGLLAALGLGALLGRDAATLSAGERRTLALALALGAPRGRVVVLCEPFDEGGGLPEAWVAERCQALAADHLVWLLAARNPTRRFGVAPLVLHGGGWVGPGATAGFSPAGLRRTLRARVSDGRALAAALLADPAALAVGVDAADPAVVVAQGPDGPALSRALLAAAERLGVAVESLALLALDADVERVALGAVARATFEAERARQRRFGEASLGDGPGAATPGGGAGAAAPGGGASGAAPGGPADGRVG